MGGRTRRLRNHARRSAAAGTTPEPVKAEVKTKAQPQSDKTEKGRNKLKKTK